MKTLSSLLASLIALLGVAFVVPAHAEEPSSAEALFNEGRAALAAQQYDVACAKFRESDRLDPAVGTHLNLANCEEQRGHVATARTLFEQALIQLGPEDPRSAVAKDRIQALNVRVSRLTVRGQSPFRKGTQLAIAGSSFDPATAHMPLILDPGTYELHVSIPRRRAEMYSIELREGQTVDFVVPDSGDESKPSAVNDSEPAREGAHSWNAMQWTGAGAIAGGAVALGLSTYFAFAAASKNSDSSKDCTGDVCGSQGYDDRTAALSRGNTATAFAAVGTVLVGGGLALLIVGRDSAAESQKASRVNTFTLNAAPMGLGGQLMGRF